MHISEQIEATLIEQGFKKTTEGFQKLMKIAEAGTVSDGTRMVTLRMCDMGRWFESVDGWGAVIADLDLRNYWTDPQGAVEALLGKPQ